MIEKFFDWVDEIAAELRSWAHGSDSRGCAVDAFWALLVAIFILFPAFGCVFAWFLLGAK